MRAILVLIMSVCVVAMIPATFLLRPEQYFPVAYYRTHLYLTPDGVIVLPPNENFTTVKRPAGPEVWRVEAEVQVLRPIPLRSQGKRGYQRYAEGYNRPRAEDVARAGPERGAIVQISASHNLRRDYSRLSWPTLRGGIPEYGIAADELMPADMLDRIMPALIEDLMVQCGQEWLGDAVRQGGVPPPPLPWHRGPMVQWIPMLAMGVLAVSMFAIGFRARQSLRRTLAPVVR